MPKTTQTPAAVLQSFIDEYQTNAFTLSKSIHFDYKTLLNILKGKGKITVPTAIRLGKFFGQTPAFWINIQTASEINELSKNKKFTSIVKNIPRAQKPSAKERAASAKGKTKTLAEKRKKAAKVPGARGAKRKRAK
jgi:addiction module HigA family antidote